MRELLFQGLVLSFFFLLSFAAGGIGGRFISSSIYSWYVNLNKPSWNPPNWVFSPVWTFLYFCMSLAAWLVWWRTGLSVGLGPLFLFGLNLLLNVAWSGLFFGLRNPKIAFAEIILLWGSILATLIWFWTISPPAGLLMLPYLLWVTFATGLNFTIWRLNP